MVEVALGELSKGLDVHRLLNGGELLLQGVILARFDESENLVTCQFVDCNLLHGEHLRVNSWPVLLRGAQNLPF